jgi:Putative transmembrane protein (Alph_Pro_TM)
MRRWLTRSYCRLPSLRCIIVLGALVTSGVTIASTTTADAQNRKSRSIPSAAPAPLPKAAAKDIIAPSTDAKEAIQADVSMRSVAVTSSFNGTEVVIFGAVDNSRQASAESGLYDVVIVVEGTPTKLAGHNLRERA